MPNTEVWAQGSFQKGCMEEKPETPSPDSTPEIHSLLKSMIHEKKAPASETTALSNLKYVLSKADETATLNTPEKKANDVTPASPAPSMKMTESPTAPRASHIFASGPVKELEALIRAHRAKQ